MGDITVPAKTKELVPSSIHCPMLNTTNYTVWAMRMKIMLQIHKVWETIEGNSMDIDKNVIAIGLLFQSIPESLILQVGGLDSSKAIWEAIKTRHLGAERVKEARLQTLTYEFERLRMNDSDSIDAFSGKLSELASKSAALGEVIEEPKLVKKFLNSLPRKKYIHIIASLEQVLNLNETGFEDIVGRLKAYEERVLDDEKQDETQGKLLFTESNGYQGSYDSSRGRGRGRGARGRGRGRGQGRFNSHDGTTNQWRQNQNKEKKDRSKLICFRCEKAGHFASSCPEKPQKNQEVNKVETQEADAALYLHEIVFLNEEKIIPKAYETKNEEEGTWYLDNGASNHMTGVRSYFAELNENIKGKVKFGDGSCVDIGGKGSILFQGKTGEQQLVIDIYYIPDLKSNILSLGQATEFGCDVRIRHDYLTLHDPHGRLLVKVIRSPNRLYKINLKIGKPICLHTKIEGDTWRWHARLGHINFKTIKDMSKQEMVYGLPEIEEEKQVCEPCLVGKQTRQAFPKTTLYRASRVLELLYADLCGPISPPSLAQNRYIFRSRL
uniref:Pol polyprotein n=1 Tax=Boechera divaricarpa TaxID=115915 RepID=B6REL9_9BRAS|nr:pol polyprotein [Boechera divaricarpa]